MITQEDDLDKAYSTDWLNTPLHALSQVDSAMRCQVCKDFYMTPMITSCSHTFCSLCIRRCLSNDGRCPACRAQEQELKLRNNGAMEELVEAFKRARAEVLEYAVKSTVLENPSKRKIEENGLNEGSTSPSKKMRYSKRLQKIAESVVISDSEGDEGYKVPVRCLVRCPICNLQMPNSQVNSHLDRNCKEVSISTNLSKTNQNAINPSWNTTKKPTKRPERLPLLNISMFKDAQLRKKLAEHGLSQSGSRLVMQRRFAEWITLWNANCDATRPRPVRELRGDLERWERIQDRRGPGATSSSSQGIKIKEKDFDGKAWSNSHNDTFKELVQKAREKFSKPLVSPPEVLLEPLVKSKVEHDENRIFSPNSSQCLARLEKNDGLNSPISSLISPQKHISLFDEPPGSLDGRNSIVSEECWT
ncbi:hypothetical protein EPUL_000324, partial [Erysiphe pulchra]